MNKIRQTVNVQRRTLNAEFRRDSELDVERWTFGVGRFLLGLP